MIDIPTLTILFDPPRNNREVTVTIACSQCASHEPGSCTLTLPFDLEHTQLILRALNTRQYPDYPRIDRLFKESEDKTTLISTLRRLGVWDDKVGNAGAVAANAHEQIGRQLGTALLSNSVVKKHFDELYSVAAKQAGEVILSFAPEDEQLASLPWEAMYEDTDPIPVLLANGVLVNYSRMIRFKGTMPTFPHIEQPLHVLTVTPKVRMDPVEYAFVENARFKMRDELKKRLQVEFTALGPPVTMKELSDCLNQKKKFHILDFIGHGTFTNKGPVLLLDDEQGYSEDVPADKLAVLPNLPPLIVLNACQSAQVGINNPFSAIAIALSHAGVQAVVAMQFTVRLQAVANHIAPTFYREIAQAKSVQQAISEVRRALYREESDKVSWYVPALYLRQPHPFYLQELTLRCPDNPFMTSHFIERKREMAAIRTRLSKGMNSFSVIGSRGSGKTTLLKQIFDEYKEEYMRRPTSASRIVWLMLDDDTHLSRIKQKLTERLAEQGTLQNTRTGDWERILCDGKHAIIIIDDLSKLHTTNQKEKARNWEIRRWFKSLLEHPEMRVQMVASSQAPLETLFEADSRVKYGPTPLHSLLADKIDLECFTEEEVREFITKALAGTPFQLEDFMELVTGRMLPGELQEICKIHYNKLCKERGLGIEVQPH